MWWAKRRKRKESNLFSLRDKHQRYYQTATHQRWRLAVLARDPLCVKCLQDNVLEPSVVADHVQSLTLRWDLRSSIDNGQGYCERCHNSKSNVERLQYGQWERQRIIENTMNDLNDIVPTRN